VRYRERAPILHVIIRGRVRSAEVRGVTAAAGSALWGAVAQEQVQVARMKAARATARMMSMAMAKI
jgi:hypothetical protein